MLRLQLLSRTASEDRYVLTSSERLVLVPDEIRKCVGFAAYDPGTGRVLCGTAFVVSLPVTEQQGMRFVVTAAHILDEVAKRAVDGMLHLRFNKRGGGFVWVSTAIANWLRHPTNATIDCAAVALPLPPEADVRAYGGMSGNYLSDETIARLGVGTGDDVFFPGLFVKHSGAQENVPIVRSGAIAAMLTGPIESARGPMYAYLVEARSIGGLSGSPVFVQIPPLATWETDTSGPQPTPKRFVPRFFFMGLVHGHWDVHPISDSLIVDGLSDQAVNMGIAIVIPATNVMEVLGQPAITAILDAQRATLIARASPTSDVSR